MQLNQAFDVDVVPPTCNFIGNEILARVLSCEFLKFLQPLTLLKTRLRHSCFLMSFEKLFSLQFS